jgi:predicted membrane protein
MIVPLTPHAKPLFFGFDYFDIGKFMGQPLGWLKWPNLLVMFFSAVTFIVATYYIIQYTKGFFTGRKIPKSWKLILWGVAVTSIAEVGEMFAFYEWPNPGIFEINFLLVLPHALGGFLIGLGAYFLYKEVIS